MSKYVHEAWEIKYIVKIDKIYTSSTISWDKNIKSVYENVYFIYKCFCLCDIV